MNAPDRSELFESLEKLGRLYPSMRFGQLLEAVAVWASDTEPMTVGDVTDAQLVEAALAHIARRRSEPRQSVVL